MRGKSNGHQAQVKSIGVCRYMKKNRIQLFPESIPTHIHFKSMATNPKNLYFTINSKLKRSNFSRQKRMYVLRHLFSACTWPQAQEVQVEHRVFWR